MKIGIIGLGAFGTVLAQLLQASAEVFAFDRRRAKVNSTVGVLGCVEDFGDCDVIFIATELDSVREVCRQLKAVVGPSTIIADVCSVKVRPAEIMQEVLGGSCQLLATHPLFGPHSVKRPEDVQRQKMVWHELTDGDFGALRELFEDKIGVEIVEITPEEHDREMAWVHGLTFFAGKALLAMQPPNSTMGTNYYQKLLDLVEVEKGHSDELFMTIQRGNPYTDDIRREFMEKLQKLEDQITE